jgi:hypothetical protein
VSSDLACNGAPVVTFCTLADGLNGVPNHGEIELSHDKAVASELVATVSHFLSQPTRGTHQEVEGLLSGSRVGPYHRLYEHLKGLARPIVVEVSNVGAM